MHAIYGFKLCVIDVEFSKKALIWPFSSGLASLEVTIYEEMVSERDIFCICGPTYLTSVDWYASTSLMISLDQVALFCIST